MITFLSVFDGQPSIEIGPATDDEIAMVTRDFADDRDVRSQVDDWHLVAIRILTVEQVTLHILGRYQPLRRLVSSAVVDLASDRRRVRTQNSIYALAGPATEPPTRHMLARVAACMLLPDGSNIARISREVGHA